MLERLKKLLGMAPPKRTDVPDLIVSLGEQHESECECCDNRTLSIEGVIDRPDGVGAGVYAVQWTIGSPENGASFHLVIGPVDDKARVAECVGVRLAYGMTQQGSPGFTVVDANTEYFYFDTCPRPLPREEVVGTPLAQESFDMVDAIWMQDPRIKEVDAWPV